MLVLRDYQRSALDALYEYWGAGGGNGLIVLPTGAGKALVIAKMIEELLQGYPDMRVFNVTHSATLVQQNYDEFIGLSPFAPAGIYSASLNRRDHHAQILFAGIQSVWNKLDVTGVPDLVIVDEAHAISRNSDTLYGKFFKAIRDYNKDRGDPDASRFCGLTATDYRLDSGRMTEGDDRLFDDVVYEIGLTDLIEAGYLTRLESVKTTAKINLKGIGTRLGDYITGQMSDAAELVIDAGIAEDMVSSENCNAALFFCASQANAIHIRDAIRAHGRSCEAVISENSDDAERIFADFKAGNIWAIVSVNMIYTGANFPRVDFISLYFGTKSAGKLVQALGRGTRNYPGKEFCLVADHGKNLSYHGPIDQIRPKDPTSGDGEQPKKICPIECTDVDGRTGCGEMVPISLMKCHCCGYVFPPSTEEKITVSSDTTPVLSKSLDMWRTVTRRSFAEHPGKEGADGNKKPDSVKTTFMVGMLAVNNWLCPGHTGFAKHKADRFWRDHGGQVPFPANAQEWLLRQLELNDTSEIELEYNGKYANARAYKTGTEATQSDEYYVPETRYAPAKVEAWTNVLDGDEIPF